MSRSRRRCEAAHDRLAPDPDDQLRLHPRQRAACCSRPAPAPELRQALGTAVFFGMIGVTGFGLIFTPTFYVVCRALGDRLAARRARPAAVLAPAE